MKTKQLNPNQIITLSDFPVRNEQILKLYYRMFKKGKEGIVPPCPVIHKKIVNFDGDLKKRFEKFKESHLKAEYFLLDGTHKTTAATLAGRKIAVMIFESNKDIKKAEEMVKNGELIGLTTGSSISEIVKILRKHFRKTGKFWTVEEKTRKLVKDKKVPEYMAKRKRW